MDEAGSLAVRVSMPAQVMVDGQVVGGVVANQFSFFSVAAGEHVLRIVSNDGDLGWEELTHVPSGEQVVLQPTLTPLDPAVGVINSFKDPSDQRVYRTVRIAGLEWFAENYARVIGGALYPGGKPSNQAMGRLYDFSAAASIVPAGWRLPTLQDFQHLLAQDPNPFAYLTGPKSSFNVQYAGAEVDGYGGVGSSLCLWGSTPGPIARRGSLGDVNTRYSVQVYAPQSKASILANYAWSLQHNSVRFVRDSN
jgi:hypothetical protein